ncbi:MAG: M48 family metallopeptidase [Devosiaceae bacterium]
MFKPLRTTLEKGRARISASLPPLDMPSTVLVRGQKRPLRVRVHAKAKRMILRFDVRTGDGKLTVPRGTPPSAVLTFLSQTSGWVDVHGPEILDATDQTYPLSLPYLGQEKRIIATGKTRGTVSLGVENELHVPGAPHRIMPRLAQFLKAQAEHVLTPQVMALSERLEKRPSSIRYRDPRAQWGSCSSARVITLSWRVMMAPPEAQTYLVAHEVAHLAQMNHSARFWAVVGSLDPNWKEGQKALKSFEKQLLSIRFT